MEDEYVKFIEYFTRASVEHLTPEIKVRLLGPTEIIHLGEGSMVYAPNWYWQCEEEEKAFDFGPDFARRVKLTQEVSELYHSNNAIRNELKSLLKQTNSTNFLELVNVRNCPVELPNSTISEMDKDIDPSEIIRMNKEFRNISLKYEPFWYNYFPGEQAIARYILDNAYKVKNLSVLEIGCGCGAASIAAAMSKAKTVTANDIDPVAITACRLNAELNKVNLMFNLENLIGTDVTQDIIILSEVTNADHYQTFKWICKLKEEGKTVLLGDNSNKTWIGKIEENNNYCWGGTGGCTFKQLEIYELPYHARKVDWYDFETVSRGVVYTVK